MTATASGAQWRACDAGLGAGSQVASHVVRFSTWLRSAEGTAS